MRLLVCGGRDFSDRVAAFAMLDYLHAAHGGLTRIIQGGAKGADALAKEWANLRNVGVTQVDADWNRLGKRAGPARNQTMLDTCEPDAVLAFPGGVGTADMIRRAEAKQVTVIFAK